MAGTPEKPIAQEDQLTNLYTMFYRHLTNHLVSLNFRHPGGLDKARERAESHCNVMGYKLHFVQPLISNLSLEESYYLGTERRPPKVREVA